MEEVRQHNRIVRSVMKTAMVVTMFLLNYVENSVVPLDTSAEAKDEEASPLTNSERYGLIDEFQSDPMEHFENIFDKQTLGDSNKPCTIVVLSNSQTPNAQTLVRKYSYDSNGILIPSSVRYYMKVAPEGKRSKPVLIPLNDKAFTPLGGFIRYYKEVPPIPQTSW